jgi:hypothetical protein
MIKGVFPRDSLIEGSEVVSDDENLPKMSMVADGFRARAEVTSHVVGGDVSSEADSAELGE